MNCSLCMKTIDGEPFYVDKYPHHKDCQTKVLQYLKMDCNCGFIAKDEKDYLEHIKNCSVYWVRQVRDERTERLASGNYE